MEILMIHFRITWVTDWLPNESYKLTVMIYQLSYWLIDGLTAKLTFSSQSKKGYSTFGYNTMDHPGRLCCSTKVVEYLANVSLQEGCFILPVHHVVRSESVSNSFGLSSM